MSTKAFSLLACALVLLAVPGAQAAHTDVQPYVGGPPFFGPAATSCGSHTFNVNSVCFPLSGADTTVRLTIEDMQEAMPVGAKYGFWTAPAADDPLGLNTHQISSGTFCGTTTAPVPADAGILIVYLSVDGPIINLGKLCAPATAGAVVAEFA
jgi:hypothetical protein